MIAAPVVKTIPSNEELAKKGEALYTTLIQEGKEKYKYDPYQPRSKDKFTEEAIERVKVDEERRKHVHGPSIKKEKFTNKYWRVWHKEKTLLEELSRKHAEQEAEAAAKGASTKKIVPPIPRKPLEGVRASSFGGSFDKKVTEKYFDNHIIGGSNTPSQLFQSTYKRNVPANPTTLNSTYDPDNIGGSHNVKGGDFCQTNYSIQRVPHTETTNCDYPPTMSLVSDSKGTKFKSTPRFPSESKLKSSHTNSVSNIEVNKDPDPGPRFTGSSKFKFNNELRESQKVNNSNRSNSDIGPGYYEIPRLFEGKGYPTSEDFNQLCTKYESIPQGLLGLTPAQTAKIGLFGVGCNRQEHVLYGMCLDGRCCQRAQFESTMIRRNDLRRLAGYEAVDKMGRNKDNLEEEIYLSKIRNSLLTDAVYHMDALYAAAHRGDADAIINCARLKVDPNTRHPDSGYTALHVAVAKCRKESVYHLLVEFRGIIDLNIQDVNGDTALHLGSRLGYDDLVALICDEPSCDPYARKNNKGEYPMDINKSHGVYTYMKLAIDRNNLKKELEELRRRNNRPTSSRGGYRPQSSHEVC